MARPLNYTTKIEAKQTTGECLDLLVQAGASGVAVQYRDKAAVGLSFEMDTVAGLRGFVLPVNIDAMHAVLRNTDFSSLKAGQTAVDRYKSRDHAARVAWRVVKDWLEAQLALIAAEMASLDQVMLPYLAVAQGETLYDRFLTTHGQMAIES